MTHYAVTVRYQSGSEFQNNVFTYDGIEVENAAVGITAMANAFVEDMFPAIRGVIVSATSIVGLKVIDLGDDALIDERTFTYGTLPGLRSGDNLPPFVAWGFKNPREVRTIGHGFKRFGRVSETDQSAGQPAAGVVSALTTLANAMSATITDSSNPNAGTFTPTIVKRVKYTTPAGRTAYRLPREGETVEFYYATNWTFQRITTQNSRKFGVGE